MSQVYRVGLILKYTFWCNYHNNVKYVD